MADNVMAILQEVDKCIRCNGCYIACKRTWNMLAGDQESHGKHRVAAYQRVVIKSQKRTDMGPFVRFSCWHCENPPCAGRCPKDAINKMPDGSVWVDNAKCVPAECQKQCVADCQRGGFPKVGVGNLAGDNKAFKCTLCHEKSGLSGLLPTKVRKTDASGNINDASGNYRSPIYKELVALGVSASTMDEIVPELQSQPTCVYTCPAKAMHWDTRKNIIAKLTYMRDHAATDSSTGRKMFNHLGDGSMFWVSAKYTIVPPKADPFIEDHVTPMVSGALSSPLVKAAIVPTIVVGGLMAFSARRAENEREAKLAMEGEV
jgi:Fe-S-cluster-containing dehydrogenase component